MLLTLPTHPCSRASRGTEPARLPGAEDPGMVSYLERTQRVQAPPVEIGKPGGELAQVLSRKLRPVGGRTHADLVQKQQSDEQDRIAAQGSPVKHDAKRAEWGGLDGDGDGMRSARMATLFGATVNEVLVLRGTGQNLCLFRSCLTTSRIVLVPSMAFLLMV